MSYRIEITADTLAELAGKAALLAAKLNSETSQQEVAEAAPAPKPQASSIKSSTPVESTSNGQPSAPSEQEAALPLAPASPATLDYKTEVAPLVLKLVEVSGKPAAQRVLDQFGAAKASDISPDLWPELVAMIKAEMAQ